MYGCACKRRGDALCYDVSLNAAWKHHILSTFSSDQMKAVSICSSTFGVPDVWGDRAYGTVLAAHPAQRFFAGDKDSPCVVLVVQSVPDTGSHTGQVKMHFVVADTLLEKPFSIRAA